MAEINDNLLGRVKSDLTGHHSRGTTNGAVSRDLHSRMDNHASKLHPLRLI
jgi:hypothetical protein